MLTNVLIKNNLAREGNPFLLHIAGGSGLIIIKIIGVLVAAFILWDIHRRYPRLAFWTASIFLLVYLCIVVWNIRLLILG